MANTKISANLTGKKIARIKAMWNKVLPLNKMTLFTLCWSVVFTMSTVTCSAQSFSTTLGVITIEDVLSSVSSRSQLVFNNTTVWQSDTERLFYKGRYPFVLNNGQTLVVILLLTGPGNRSCPALWKIAVVSSSGVKLTPSFGDCMPTDGPVRVKQTGSLLLFDFGISTDATERVWALNQYGTLYSLSDRKKALTKLW